MRKKHDIIEISTFIRHQTADAVLVEDGENKIWLPKSQVQIESHNPTNGYAEISLPEWLAIEKRLL